MVLFFCTFIALRGQDSSDPVSRIKDYQLDGEELVFSGYSLLLTSPHTTYTNAV